MISRFSKILGITIALFLSFLTSTTVAFTAPTRTFRHDVSSMASWSSSSIRMADGGPAVLDKPETVEKVVEDKATEKDASFDNSGWEIRLFNDPFNKREFVARCLTTICGKSDSESYQIMMQAHKDGMGVVGRYAFEVAELYYASLQENGLLVDMVPVEEE